MKFAIFIALLALTQARLLHSQYWIPLEDKGPVSPSTQVLSGFVSGMALDASIDQLLPCLVDVEVLLKEFGEAVLEFEKMSMHGILSGIKLTEKALGQMPSAVKECMSDLKNDYLRLQNSLQVLKHPLSVNFVAGESFEVNGIELFHEISTIVQSFHEQKWNQLGFSFGAILGKVCGSGIIITRLD